MWKGENNERSVLELGKLWRLVLRCLYPKLLWCTMSIDVDLQRCFCESTWIGQVSSANSTSGQSHTLVLGNNGEALLGWSLEVEEVTGECLIVVVDWYTNGTDWCTKIDLWNVDWWGLVQASCSRSLFLFCCPRCWRGASLSSKRCTRCTLTTWSWLARC